MLSACDVAKFFIWRTNEDDEYGNNITNLKLQKLVDYAQGFSLALTGEPLFDEPIRKWKHGPVVPSLYHAFRRYKAGPIPTPEDFDPSAIDEETRSLLEDVFSVYGQYSAWGLRNLTHDEDPWKNAEDDGIIDVDVMREYFRDNLVNV